MRQILALLKKDWRAFCNLRRVLREQSVFKVVFILLFALGMIGGLWVIFMEAFSFLDKLGGVGLLLVYRLFALFFLGLGAMLATSSVITSYTTFFSSEETAYLLLKPLSIGKLSIYKFIQSAFYSSWAFFFTIIPFVGAYAAHEKLPIYFSVWTIFFSVPLVLLCAGLGTIVCLLGTRWLPRNRAFWWGVVAAAAVAGSLLSGRLTTHVMGENEQALVLTRLIPGFQIASHPLWPSWWISEGIMALTRGQWTRGLLLWLVLMANVLFVGMIVEWTGRRVFYDAWQRIQYSRERGIRQAVLLRPLERAMCFLPADIRALILKDIRVFFRDPAQWTQGLIFFGLLGLYFLNLRNLRYHLLPDAWRNLIAFLNVFSVSAVMCSFGSRFVYPQLSLEGHGFWVVGLSPTSMGRVLAAKFSLALAGMTAVSVGLMFLSTRMLVIPLGAKIVAGGIALAMAVGIAGLSTGLGAVFLDLRQPNPAAIVSGFGGTLNLVLSLVFMFGAILPYGFVFHQAYLRHIADGALHRALLYASLWLVLWSLTAAVVPLAAGRRSLRNREY